jgi:uncharacterized protein
MIALAVVLGVAIGVTLGALGAGGSVLAVPVLVHVVGLSFSAATASSLVAVGTAAAVGAVGHRAHIRWAVAGWFVAAGALGALGGAAAGDRVEPDVLLLAFSALILVAAQRMLTACPSCTKLGEARATRPGKVGGVMTAAPARHRVAIVAVAGVGVGFLTGLFGVGGGFVIVPALTLAVGLAMPEAIATSLVVVAANAVVVLVVRGADAVEWSVAVPFTMTMLVGSVAGAVLARHLDPKRSLQAFATILVLVAMANAATVVL